MRKNFHESRCAVRVAVNTETWDKEPFEIELKTDSIKQHKEDEVYRREFLELVVESHRLSGREGVKLGNDKEAAFEYPFDGGTAQVCTRVEPTLKHLLVSLLNVAVAQEDVIGSLGREWLVPAGMDKQDGELENTIHFPMVLRGCEARNVKETHAHLACLSFLVARPGRRNASSLAGVVGQVQSVHWRGPLS